MKILLVQPRVAEACDKEYLSLQFPLNLGYIAAVLRQHGHETRLVDLNVQGAHVVTDVLDEFGPDMVGVTSMTPAIYNAAKLISRIKIRKPNVITVLGGVHASALPEQTIRDIGSLDYLVFGEGEATILDLIEHAACGGDLGNVDGIVFRRNEEIVRNRSRQLIENLDTIPFPARDLIPMDLYARAHVNRGFSRRDMRIAEIMTTRGCPNDCIFCAGHLNYGHRVRFRSPENVKAELISCIEQYKITHVSVEDDTFTLSNKLVRELCDFFLRERMTWNCYARVDTVDYEVLRLMARSGCRKVAFGVESGSPEILERIRKGITVDQVRGAVREAKRAGIRYVECDFMLGAHPDETPEHVQATLELIYELMPDFVALSVMCPFPGTEVYRLMVERGYLSGNPDWSQFNLFGDLNRYERITHMTSDEMWTIQHRFNKRYYGSARYVLSQVRQIRSLAEARYFARAAVLFSKEFLWPAKAGFKP